MDIEAGSWGIMAAIDGDESKQPWAQTLRQVSQQTFQQIRVGNLKTTALAGLGLAGSLWAVDNVTDLLGEWLPAIVLGSGISWLGLWMSQLPSNALSSRKPVTIEGVKASLMEAQSVVNTVAVQMQLLAVDESDRQQSNQLAEALRSQLHEILSALKRDQLNLAILGRKGVGKTTLFDWLNINWLQEENLKDLSHKVKINDTRSLLSSTDLGDAEALSIGRAADLVVFVIDGDLLESELQVLLELNRAYRRSVIVLNKQDQYLPKEQDELLAKIRDRVSGMIAREDVMTIATQPRPIKVRQHQSDGSTKEWLEEPEPQVQPLTQRLQTILVNDAQKLIMASSLGNAEALKALARKQLNEKRRGIALPMIERSQWVVAGTAFATPFPAIDLLATAAINGQMVADLSSLYQQKFSLEQAKTIAKTLSELMIKLGIVEVSTQAVGAILKTNALTYMAGGAVQGVSGAYLTRIAGLALIEYWESDDRLMSTVTTAPPIQRDRLQTILKAVFQQNQRSTFLQGFVTQAFDRLIRRNTLADPIEPKAIESTQRQDLQVRAKLPTLESQHLESRQDEPDLETIGIEQLAENLKVENYEILPR
jgi:uncharacterized protein